MDGQLTQYLAVLILLGVAIAFAAGMLIFSKVIGKRAKGEAIKDTPYECGMLPEGSGAPRMSIKFYLVAMLFILFDIEVVFLFPWAASFGVMSREFGAVVLVEMAVFIGILVIGWLYAWRKGSLEWG